jgi:hypothetical protein
MKMNTIQKAFVIIALSSITAFFLSHQVGINKNQRYKNGYFYYSEPVIKKYSFNGKEYESSKNRPNWVAIISTIILVGSGAGFFLFKDE